MKGIIMATLKSARARLSTGNTKKAEAKKTPLHKMKPTKAERICSIAEEISKMCIGMGSEKSRAIRDKLDEIKAFAQGK